MFGEALAAIVLVPRDLVVEDRRGKNVHVAVTVDVGREYRTGAGGGRRDRALSEVLATVVLVPGDLSVVMRRRENIHVAITIYIRRKHRFGAVRSRRDRVCREASAAIVLVPCDLVVLLRRGKDIHIAITVYICRKHRMGPVSVRGDHTLLPKRPGTGLGTDERDLVVLDFTIICDAAGGQIAGRAQAEPGVGSPWVGPTGHIERDRVVPVRHGQTIGNLLEWPAPRSIGIEVNPCIQLDPDKSILHVDNQAPAELTYHDRRAERDAVLVIRHARDIVAGRGRRRLTVGFVVATSPQSGTYSNMPCTIRGQCGRIRRWGVTEVRGDSGVGNLKAPDSQGIAVSRNVPPRCGKEADFDLSRDKVSREQVPICSFTNQSSCPIDHYVPGRGTNQLKLLPHIRDRVPCQATPSGIRERHVDIAIAAIDHCTRHRCSIQRMNQPPFRCQRIHHNGQSH